MLEVEAVANAVFVWAAERILAARLREIFDGQVSVETPEVRSQLRLV